MAWLPPNMPTAATILFTLAAIVAPVCVALDLYRAVQLWRLLNAQREA